MTVKQIDNEVFTAMAMGTDLNQEGYFYMDVSDLEFRIEACQPGNLQRRSYCNGMAFWYLGLLAEG